MLSSIIERSNKLLDFISVIHQGLLKILSLTCTQPRRRQAQSQQMPPLHSPGRAPSQTTSDSNISNKHSLHASTNVSCKSTPQGSLRDFSKHSVKHSQSVGTVVMARTPVPQDSMADLEPGVETAMLYFCEATLDIAQKMVLKSHEEYSRCLLNGTRSSSDLGEAGGKEASSGKANNRVVRFDVPDTPEKVESLVEVLKQDKEAMKDKMDSLMSAFSER